MYVKIEGPQFTKGPASKLCSTKPTVIATATISSRKATIFAVFDVISRIPTSCGLPTLTAEPSVFIVY
nr:unnamed protein product [Spirometra erinaceieuropaei]